MNNFNAHFDGPDYEPENDKARLSKQIQRVFAAMIDEKWRTLDEIARKTGDPAASVSAQLRHLRKPKFGGHTVNKKRSGDRKNGLFVYQLIPNRGEPKQEEMAL